MNEFVIAVGGFLLAVLWFDLMFDVQVLHHPRDRDLPEPVLASVAAYYRRVTTDAAPMGYFVGFLMILAMGLLVCEALTGPEAGIAMASLVVGGVPMLLAMLRIMPNGIRLGQRQDDAATQSRLARAICHEHLFCLVAILVFLGLQLGVIG